MSYIIFGLVAPYSTRKCTDTSFRKTSSQQANEIVVIKHPVSTSSCSSCLFSLPAPLVQCLVHFPPILRHFPYSHISCSKQLRRPRRSECVEVHVTFPLARGACYYVLATLGMKKTGTIPSSKCSLRLPFPLLHLTTRSKSGYIAAAASPKRASLMRSVGLSRLIQFLQEEDTAERGDRSSRLLLGPIPDLRMHPPRASLFSFVDA